MDPNTVDQERNSQHERRKRHFASLIVFLLLGIVAFVWGLWLISALPKDSREVEKYWALTLQGLGFTLGTVAIVSLVWKLLGGDPIDDALTDLEAVSDETKAAVGDLKENIGVLKTAQDDVIKSVSLLADSRKSGIERVYAYSTHVSTQEAWMQRFKSAQECIDLMGYTLLVWTKGVNFEQELARRVLSGVRVRILIMDEENPQLIAVLNSKIPGAILEQTKAEIAGTKGSMKYVATRLREAQPPAGSFEFRTLKRRNDSYTALPHRLAFDGGAISLLSDRVPKPALRSERK